MIGSLIIDKYLQVYLSLSISVIINVLFTNFITDTFIKRVNPAKAFDYKYKYVNCFLDGGCIFLYFAHICYS